MSPDRSAKSFKREVIYRKPHEFKIACLTNIRNLFPSDSCPFAGGFGNRDTDALSYRAIGIELERIFLINKQSQISHFNSTITKSYSLLSELVNEIFPKIVDSLSNM